MTTFLAQFGNAILLVLGALLVLALLRTMWVGLRWRRAAYYSVRRETLNVLRRWALVAGVLLVIFLALGFIINGLPPAAITQLPPTSTLGVPSTPTPIVTPSRTPSPTAPPPSVTPTLTPTLTLTATATVTPTLTPVPPPDTPSILLTPLPGAVPPAANAQLSSAALASVLDNSGNPVDAGTLFPAGTRRIRVFFRAINVNNGATWSVLCYQGDQLVDQFVGLWQWGPRSQPGRAFCAIDGAAGLYRVVGYLGTTPHFSLDFELIETEPAPTIDPAPTPTP